MAVKRTLGTVGKFMKSGEVMGGGSFGIGTREGVGGGGLGSRPTGTAGSRVVVTDMGGAAASRQGPTVIDRRTPVISVRPPAIPQVITRPPVSRCPCCC